MRSVPLVAAVLLACCPLAASAVDPLKSPACGRSLAALQAARAAAGDIESLRRQATQACLGGSGEPRRPSPTAQPPVVVPPPVIEVPAPPDAPVDTPPAPPPVTIDRPPVLTSCDLGGCWTSDGTRLNRSGPLLIGPGGACVTAGPVVRCP
ncbi:hypothetical protein PE066_21105 [Ramlibacter tataouinensis]|uniref:hypothetical protein n=1 Tax=Ramlibacter tataouinensis TaxID=94132 RepID=UPI0022F38648|nr:hypothetical protein [Ramlibacter tataouinensis]WBY01911.1 hypothetical protein PE066_21105 [Ramlibacter tataouinensis]